MGNHLLGHTLTYACYLSRPTVWTSSRTISLGCQLPALRAVDSQAGNEWHVGSLLNDAFSYAVSCGLAGFERLRHAVGKQIQR
jgi:hypothetical protein